MANRSSSIIPDLILDSQRALRSVKSRCISAKPRRELLEEVAIEPPASLRPFGELDRMEGAGDPADPLVLRGLIAKALALPEGMLVTWRTGATSKQHIPELGGLFLPRANGFIFRLLGGGICPCCKQKQLLEVSPAIGISKKTLEGLVFGSNSLEVINETMLLDLSIGMLRRAEQSRDQARQQKVFRALATTILQLPEALQLLFTTLPEASAEHTTRAN